MFAELTPEGNVCVSLLGGSDAPRPDLVGLTFVPDPVHLLLGVIDKAISLDGSGLGGTTAGAVDDGPALGTGDVMVDGPAWVVSDATEDVVSVLVLPNPSI